jgi:hypothetical protein
MSEPGTFDWIFLLAMMFVLGWWYFVQAVYFVRRLRSRRWPTADATIQKGALGGVSVGRGASVPASFMGYAFVVNNVRYAGLFAVCGDQPFLHRLSQSICGQTIQIRYNPSDPNMSFLVDYYDPRFGGKVATQNPERLESAPPFDIQDTIQ